MKITGRIWSSLLLFGLVGQIAWVIENMYFNVFLYKTVTYDPNAVAIMVAASGVVAAVTTLVMGGLSDRIGRRRHFISWGYVVWGLTIMVFALISKQNTAKWFGMTDTGKIVAATVAIIVVMDCVMTFFGSTASDSSFTAWTTDVTVPENRGRVDGVLSAMPLVAMLIVFGALDGLTQNGNWVLFFMIVGGAVSVSGLVGVILIRDDPGLKPAPSGYFKELIQGFRPSIIRQNWVLYLIFLAVCVYSTGQQVWMPYLLVYIQYGLGIVSYVIPLAILLILSAVVSILGGRLADKLGKPRLLIPCAGLTVVGLLLVYVQGKVFAGTPSIANQVSIVIGGTVMMGGGLLLFALLNAAGRDVTPERQRGHFSGIRMIFSVLIPMVIGPFIGSAIIRSAPTYQDEFGATQYIPNPGIFLGAAIVSLLLFVPLVWVVRALRKAPTTPASLVDTPSESQPGVPNQILE